MKGLIEKKYPEEFDKIKSELYKIWDSQKGVFSDVPYFELFLTRRRFLFDSFWNTKLKIGDGVGINGMVIPECTDEILHTALKSSWSHYRNDRPTGFAGK